MLAEDDILASVTITSVMLNAVQNSFTVGGLSSVFGMLTGLQLIVHSPLINV